jgi:branched-chain amino acid aminotransferase
MAGSQDFSPDPRNAEALIYLNGRMVSRADAKVSLFDAGFLVGDGIWEGIRLHKGTLLFVEEHLDRLYWGAGQIGLDIGLDRPGLLSELKRTIDTNHMHDGVHIRLMVTRGEKSAPNQDPRNALGKPTVAIVAEYKLPNPTLMSQGLNLATSSVMCTPAQMFDMRLNSHSRLNLIKALLEAIGAGADEALMLDPLGFVSSCNATNFFVVRAGVVVTSKGAYCFNGVTRSHVINLCRGAGIPVELRDFALPEVHMADEAFVTGTFGGITPVRVIDGNPFSGALPGPITQRVHQLYVGLQDAQATAKG